MSRRELIERLNETFRGLAEMGFENTPHAEDLSQAAEALTMMERALEEIKGLKSEPIGDSGFATGPAVIARRAQEIARNALKARLALDPSTTEGKTPAESAG